MIVIRVIQIATAICFSLAGYSSKVRAVGGGGAVDRGNII